MINSQQKAVLDAMGVPVWVRRDSDAAEAVSVAQASSAAPARPPMAVAEAPAPSRESTATAADRTASYAASEQVRQMLAPGSNRKAPARPDHKSANRSVADMAVADMAVAAAATEVALMDWSTLETAVGSCQLCGLHETRNRVVFGTGNREARWLFIGEAPGAEEDRQGAPFVGRAGQLLGAMIAALGMKREQVFIANVLKCRPPGNRDPYMDEVVACEPYLKRQISLIQPGVIVALGRHAAHSLLRTDLSMAKLRGQSLDYQGTPLVATYHPAYLLRNPADKRKVWADLCRARGLLKTP